jgi:hypothetical protein
MFHIQVMFQLVFQFCFVRVQLVAKKTGTVRIKLTHDTFLQFFHSVKPSYER